MQGNNYYKNNNPNPLEQTYIPPLPGPGNAPPILNPISGVGATDPNYYISSQFSAFFQQPQTQTEGFGIPYNNRGQFYQGDYNYNANPYMESRYNYNNPYVNPMNNAGSTLMPMEMYNNPPPKNPRGAPYENYNEKYPNKKERPNKDKKHRKRSNSRSRRHSNHRHNNKDRERSRNNNNNRNYDRKSRGGGSNRNNRERESRDKHSGGGGGGGGGDVKRPPVMREGDWICKSCKNLNFSHRNACNRCKEQKPSDSSNYVRDNSQRNFERDNNNNNNNNRRKYSGGGGGGGGMRGGGGGGGRGGGRGGGPRGGGGGGGIKRPPLGVQEGDWTCPDCQNINFARRVKCNLCGLAKPEGKTGEAMEGGDRFGNRSKSNH